MFLDEADVSDTTLTNYSRILYSWEKWLILNGIPWQQARRPHVIRYKKQLYDNGLSPLTVNTYLTVLRKFYQWTEINEYFKDIATSIRGFKRYTGFRKKPLMEPQVHQLIKAIDTATVTGWRNYCIIRLMILAGLRTIEVSRLNVGDFYNNGTRGVDVLGKGRTEKTFIPIGSDLVYEINQYLKNRKHLKPEDPLFTSESNHNRGFRIQPASISRIVKKSLRDIGITSKEYSAHSLRHTTAIRLIMAKKSLFEVQSFLRHTDTNMTRNYLRFLEDMERRNAKWIDEMTKKTPRKVFKTKTEKKSEH